MNNFWDQRYSDKEYVYGITPNEFFKKEIEKLKPGKILLPGEGEGRNAVYAAKLGWQVDAFDSSLKAKEKALKLADETGVSINYQIKSIESMNIIEGSYDAVGIIFLHLRGNMRQMMHTLAENALKPGGKLILELFEKDQVGKTSGGPSEIEVLYSLTEIENSFTQIKFEHLCKMNVELNEGFYHSGEASVIRLLGTKEIKP